MATSVVNPRVQFFANNGRPLIGGRIHTYVAGSSTRARTYKDAAKAQPNTNPIILDGRGEAQIYLAEGVEYKFVVEDSKGALIYTQEPVYGAIWPNAEQWPSDAALAYKYMLEAKATAEAAALSYSPFETYAQMVAGLPALQEGVAEVAVDETRDNARVRYRVKDGVATFLVNMDQLRIDLTNPSGSEPAGGFIDYSKLRAYSGPAIRAQVLQKGLSGHFSRTAEAIPDNGGTVIVDALGRSWVREFSGRVAATWFSTDGTLTAAAVTAALDAAKEGSVVSAVGDITGAVMVGQFDLLDGEKARASRINGAVTVAGSYNRVQNFQIIPPDNSTAAITITNPSGVDYYQSVKDVRVVGQNGVDSNGIEVEIDNLRILGAGSENGGVGLKLANWDHTVRNYYCEEVRVGISTSKGLQLVDGHIVRAEVAISLEQNGHPTQLLNVYLDGPKKYGIQFNDMSDALISNVQVLRVGRFWSNYNETAAFFFDAKSKHNKIINVTYNQDDLATLASGFWFVDGAVNNVLGNIGGTYKMSDLMSERMRQQTCYGMTGGWARHNNLVRKNRTRASRVPAGETVDLVFTLDWSYPEPSYNFYLFKGTWVSRATDGKSAYGELYTFVGHDVDGLTSTMTKIAGHANASWAITGRTLIGNTLTITVQNTGTSAASISMEIERSVDPMGRSF